MSGTPFEHRLLRRMTTGRAFSVSFPLFSSRVSPIATAALPARRSGRQLFIIGARHRFRLEGSL